MIWLYYVLGHEVCQNVHEVPLLPESYTNDRCSTISNAIEYDVILSVPYCSDLREPILIVEKSFTLTM